MHHSPTELPRDNPQLGQLPKKAFANFLESAENFTDYRYECKTSDYVLNYLPILPLNFVYIAISADHLPLFIIDHLVIFLSAILHQVVRAFREYILWKNYTRRGYRCIPVLSATSGKKFGPQQVALVPMPSFAAITTKFRNRSNRVDVLRGQGRSPSSKKASTPTQSEHNKGIPLESAAQMASEAQALVQRSQVAAAAAAAAAAANQQGAASDLIAVSSMARNGRVPAYCVRTRAGYVACTSSPYTINTHGKPIVCTLWYFIYGLVAFAEAILAVVVVVGIATFNGWMAISAVIGSALGHSLTHWQAVTVIQVKESP